MSKSEFTKNVSFIEHLTVLVACAAAMLVYINDARRQDAAKFNERLVKDRHTTARNLRSYYLRSLAKLLDADFDQ